MKGTKFQWQYKIDESWKQVFYNLVADFARDLKNNQLKLDIEATNNQIDKFLTLLICSSKLTNRKRFFNLLMADFQQKRIEADKYLNNKNFKVKKGQSCWIGRDKDERICQYVADLLERSPKFSGQKKDIAEFILRFSLSQLLADYQSPMLAVLLEAEENRRVSVKEINQLLSAWDYSKIFI